jgi:carboxyl-terminal processing protease
LRFLLRPIFVWMLCTLSMGIRCPAQATGEDKVPLQQRVWIACQVYSLTNAYFAHWRGVPELDLDKEFQAYLNRAVATEDRYSFDLASMELLAKLKNGHTGFRDSWLTDHYGEILGFYAYPIDGSWVVSSSSIPELRIGDIISRIDGQNFEDFFKARRQYVSASNDRAAHRFFFEYPFVFPRSFSLELADNRKLAITRHGRAEPEHYEVTVKKNGDELYIKLPSFAEPRLEDAAVRAVEDGGNTKAIIIDVRGNHGGSTPVTLLASCESTLSLVG